MDHVTQTINKEITAASNELDNFWLKWRKKAFLYLLTYTWSISICKENAFNSVRFSVSLIKKNHIEHNRILAKTQHV
jgi:hypothetical protein